MQKGSKVIFVGQEYNLAKIFKYEEIFKNKELVVEEIIECPCKQASMNKLKFKDIEGYYKQIFFQEI